VSLGIFIYDVLLLLPDNILGDIQLKSVIYLDHVLVILGDVVEILLKIRLQRLGSLLSFDH